MVVFSIYNLLGLWLLSEKRKNFAHSIHIPYPPKIIMPVIKKDQNQRSKKGYLNLFPNCLKKGVIVFGRGVLFISINSLSKTFKKLFLKYY